MRKALVFLSFVLLFSISFSLTETNSYVKYPYVLSSPEVYFELNGNAQVYSATSNASNGINSIPLYPSEVGGNGTFEVKLSEVPCNLYGSLIEVNITVNSSDGVQTFTKDFEIGNPIEIKSSDNIAVEVGNTYSTLLKLVNNGNSKLNITSTEIVPNVVYVTYYTPKGFNEELGNFTLDSTYPIRVNFIGSYIGNGEYKLSMSDPDCNSINATYTAKIQTYTVSKGISTYKSMDTGIGILFLLVSVVLIVKLIKVEK